VKKETVRVNVKTVSEWNSARPSINKNTVIPGFSAFHIGLHGNFHPKINASEKTRQNTKKNTALDCSIMSTVKIYHVSDY
jgi:hypothetical protein